MRIPTSAADFRRWLSEEISHLDDEQPDTNQYYEAADTIRVARRIAIGLDRPDVAELCRIRTPALALTRAQEILAACRREIKAKRAKADFLTPPQVARMLGVNPDKVLRWIRSGELKASNFAKQQGGRPRYGIAAADLESFRNRRAVDPPQKSKRRPAWRGKSYY